MMAITKTDDRSVARGAAPKRGLHRTGAFESERFYTHRLSLLSRLMARTTKTMLAENFGMSQMEWRVLVQLEYRSPSKIADIHERSLMQKPQISQALPALARRGYVVRQSDPADARAPWFAITEEGLALHRDVIRISRRRQHRLEAALHERERTAFESALDRFIGLFIAAGDTGDIFADSDAARSAATARTRKKAAR